MLNVYGALLNFPNKPPDTEIEGYGELQEDQLWIRRKLPNFFEIVEYSKDGTLNLTEQQVSYATQEVIKCRNGHWFFNNGEPTYITGKNYFYLTYWKLETDIYPNYRDTDRRYFLFLNFWENVDWCLGIFRGKKRREGASSQATSNLIYECIFFMNTKCGIVSKTQIDSKNTFTDMAAFGYRNLPPFLKPKQLNSEDTVSELLFANKATSFKAGYVASTVDLGHRSKLNFRAPVINAYDSGRLNRILADEGGKWPTEVPFSRFISIVTNTLVVGAKKVGFAECPSTVNEMTKAGGEEFAIVWKNANQFKHPNGSTPNGFVTYFSPAFDGFEGFIDKYGFSVIEEPTEKQLQYLLDFKEKNKLRITVDDIKKGSKAYLLWRRGLQTDPALLEEEIRQYPFDEEEMFMYAGFSCEFSAKNIQMQLKDLEDNPVFLRKMRFNLDVKEIKSIYPGKPSKFTKQVKAMDAESGGWHVFELPRTPNSFTDRGGYIEPANTSLYSIGVDTTKDLVGTYTSKPRIVVFMKSMIEEGIELGMKPVAMYLLDTRLDVHFDEEVLKACMLYGCKANYEIDARSDYYRYFSKENAGQFLEWTPQVMRNPIKKNFKVEPGTRSGDPFQFAQQLQLLKSYVDGTDNEVYNGHVHRIVYPSLLKQLLKFNNVKRTPFDEVIALAMSLAPIFASANIPAPFRGVKTILPTYKIKMSV